MPNSAQETAWDAPRQRFGAPREGERELLPVRQADGKWERRAVPLPRAPEEDEDFAPAVDAEPPPRRDALAEAATEVATATATRSRIAKMSAQILEAPGGTPERAAGHDVLAFLVDVIQADHILAAQLP